jgi:hypothetical protein
MVTVMQASQATPREGAEPVKEKLEAWVARHPVLQRDARDVAGGLLIYLGREIAINGDVVEDTAYDAANAGAPIINEAYRVITTPSPRLS